MFDICQIAEGKSCCVAPARYLLYIIQLIACDVFAFAEFYILLRFVAMIFDIVQWRAWRFFLYFQLADCEGQLTLDMFHRVGWHALVMLHDFISSALKFVCAFGIVQLLHICVLTLFEVFH